ncbi:response regulator [Rhizobium alvei]|uniref:Response regulator n=1 Tax=Rhizobium alvei TaxID=1132659 RepID=A0ABT8YMD8_9HYPH|nr:response regulator [Rhizobium alvei]MDO6964464.1 response regulator [Rhizobium alvei]
MIRLLVVDENDASRQSAATILKPFGFDVQMADNPLTALAACGNEMPRAMIVDGRLGSALELIVSIRAMPQGRTVRILYALDKADLRRLMEAKAAGADDFVLKPFEQKGLAQALADLKLEARQAFAVS